MPAASPAAPMCHRFEVTAKSGQLDPIGLSVIAEARSLGVVPRDVRAHHVYFITASLSSDQLSKLSTDLLADPVAEACRIGVAPVSPSAQVVEVHPLPGVMDPVAQSVELAVRDLLGPELASGTASEHAPVTVSTGWRYDLEGVSNQQADLLARRLLANGVIHRIYREPVASKTAPKVADHDRAVGTVPITTLDDAALAKLSRSAHLFLSLEEMQAIQTEYRRLGREPREIELETLAQTWSEHCVHKTLKSRITYTSAVSPASDPAINWHNRPGHTVLPDGTVVIENLLKSTVAAATFKLIEQGVDWTLSVFKDNSGVIAFDDTMGVCIKVETHNRPSAIEPYGGAATGAGGCIRDVIGTGLGARPIASTDVFCVARPDHFLAAESDGAESTPITGPSADKFPVAKHPVPRGLLHPERTLKQVVAGVRDYGNRMGIPTIGGAVFFDDRYIGNPLVFCGCIGLIPRDKVKGAAKPGDRIIAVGGRTGRDGVHGATFSSAGLEDKSADEFAHAVQIGNAIEEKRVLDAILRARDEDPSGPLYNGMTDCGAGGFSSAVGEMGSKLGAEVHLDRAPLKYPGLSAVEIWISEAQERMVLAVPEANVEKLRAICAEESVEIADLGHFGTPSAELILNYHGTEVGRMDMHFVHDGIPTPLREAHWSGVSLAAGSNPSTPSQDPHIKDALFTLLAHPNIASKHWIIRQYDHEVRAATVIKPLVGPKLRGPADASVIAPIRGSHRAVAVACGLSTWAGDPANRGDPYQLALAGIDEAVRNIACVGADPDRTAILDNFCWPSCGKPANLAALVRACEGCYDGALAYKTPFVSGKDSLNNQFTTDAGVVIEIPYTLLITSMAIVPDARTCVTSDAKQAGNLLIHLGPTCSLLGGSHFQHTHPGTKTLSDRAHISCPSVDLKLGPAAARTVYSLIQRGLIRSAHDVSDGGALCAVAEMLIGGTGGRTAGTPQPLGAELNLAALHHSPLVAAFAEGPSRYILEVSPHDEPAVLEAARASGIPATRLGTVNGSGTLTAPGAGLSAAVGDLAAAWLKPLDW